MRVWAMTQKTFRKTFLAKHNLCHTPMISSENVAIAPKTEKHLSPTTHFLTDPADAAPFRAIRSLDRFVMFLARFRNRV